MNVQAVSILDKPSTKLKIRTSVISVGHRPQLMPYGTPDEVRSEVRRNLEIAGEKGGLFCCPTHMLEPEVPWENIEAYVDACQTF